MKVTIPETVLSTDLENEGVLLNLETGEYYGLDPVALDMWKALGESGSVEEARAILLDKYEVDAETLDNDIRELVAQLVAKKLIHVTDD